jgi:hypothetical protein
MKHPLQSRLKSFSGFILTIAVFLSITVNAFSQSIAINTTGSLPDPSAGIDINIAGQGMLIPRVALTGTTGFAPLAAHVAGMIVYNTATTGDVSPGFYKNDGTKWTLCNSAGNSAGDMQFWNGSAWIIIPAGQVGQYLQINGSGIPVWTGIALPILTTTAVTSITPTTAVSGGNISNNGGGAITVFGVCWSTLPNPATSLTTKTIGVSGSLGNFVSNLSGLITGTTYYIRAYATNLAGTAYGNQLTFTTP